MIRVLILILGVCVVGVRAQGQGALRISEPERVFVRPTGLDIPVNQIVKDQDGFLWIGTDEGIFRYDGYDFENLSESPEIGYPLRQSVVTGLFADAHNNLWISTTRGLFVLTADRRRILAYSFGSAIRKDVPRNDVFSEGDEEVWFANHTTDILRFDLPVTQSDSLVPTLLFQYEDYDLEEVHVWGDSVLIHSALGAWFVTDHNGNILSRLPHPMTFQKSVAIDLQGTQRLILTTGDTLFVLDHATGDPKAVLDYPGIQYFLPIYWLATDSFDNSVWIGGQHGTLWKYQFPTEHFMDYTAILERKVFDEQFERTQTGLQGSEKVFWIGTSTGLFRMNTPATRNFEILERPPDSRSSRTFSTRGMKFLEDGSLLIGGYKGMFRYDRTGRFLKQYFIWGENGWSNPIAYEFLADGDSVLIASEGNGLLWFNPRTDSVGRVSVIPDPKGIDDINAFNWNLCIERDIYGVLWIGSIRGVFIVDDWHVLRRFGEAGEVLRNARIYDIRQTPDSTLWFATSSGLYSVNPERSVTIAHNVTQSPATAVNTIVPLSTGELCLGTRGEGLIFFSPVKGVLQRIGQQQGLPDAVVCSIEEGVDGELWVSTNDGLASIDSTRRDIQSYSVSDGLPHDEFNHSSAARAHDGKLYFGGVDGVVRFDPQSDALTVGDQGKLRVSKISWHDGKEETTRHTIFPVQEERSITLSHNDQYFSVYFSNTNVEEVAGQEYAYMLSGLHDDWQQNGRKNFVQITGLRPGSYTLLIRRVTTPANAADDILAIPVMISQAWYKTWPAITMYILVTAALLLFIVRDIYRRIHLRRQLQLELEHSMKLEAINRAKSTFFANITHEFKTPLTLINGPAEEIERQTTDPKIKRYARVISKNAGSILNLVTQLLDLNKLEANLDKPQFYRLDIIAYLRRWIDKFVPLAEQQFVALRLETSQSEMYVDFDPVKLEKVFINLLSNALKFTAEQGQVICEVEGISTYSATHQEMISIAIKDTGRGVDSADREHIFERFYQGKDSIQGGTGIGLAFVRELVRLHGGFVDLDPAYQQGACFRVMLPVSQDHVIEGLRPGEFSDELERQGPSNSDWRADPSPQEDSAVILIAEDHEDVATLIADTLGGFCKVYIAPNGRIAFEQAVTLVPDLIITDVMMPVMDGFTLTRQLKNDVHTSHIPIVMLTAKGTRDDRINGRRHGADVFISKPFSTAELQFTVRNLLHLRSRLLQHISNEATENVHDVQLTNSRDKEFYTRFLDFVDQNLANSELQIQDLMDHLGMSRTQLHRKLKAITGQSANQLIRGMRLQKGLSMLKDSGMNISEVAYEVGFASPSYFSESFKEYFGYTPSEASGRVE